MMVAPCYSKCGALTRSSCITWELVRHVGSQKPQIYWIKVCILTKFFLMWTYIKV